MKLDKTDLKNLQGVIDSLNLIDDSRAHLLSLMKEEKYDELIDKLEEYIKLEINKERQLANLRKNVSAMDLKDLESGEDTEVKDFGADIKKATLLRNTAIDEAYEKIEKKLDDEFVLASADVGIKMAELGKKALNEAVREAEEKEIKAIKDKLK